MTLPKLTIEKATVPMKLPGFIKWRYDLYLAEYVDLYGSLSFYFKQKFNRFLRMRNPKIVYIYANKRNVGDYISFLGIKHLVKEEGVELFCSPMWSKQLTSALKIIKQINPDCLVVIGGGGLIQPVFQPFWDNIMASGLPYVCFGIGINKMPGRPEMEADYINKLIENSALCGVRDEYTQSTIKTLTGKDVYMGICPSVNYVNEHYWNDAINEKGELLHMYHPSDVRLAGADLDKIKASLKSVAKSLGLQYSEHTNMSADHAGMLSIVSKARLVVSSRLHGCIMSYAMGVPYLPLYCDEKIRSFNQSHTGVEGICPKSLHDTEEALLSIKKSLNTTPNSVTFLRVKMNKNKEFAQKINALIP